MGSGHSCLSGIRSCLSRISSTLYYSKDNGKENIIWDSKRAGVAWVLQRRYDMGKLHPAFGVRNATKARGDMHPGGNIRKRIFRRAQACRARVDIGASKVRPTLLGITHFAYRGLAAPPGAGLRNLSPDVHKSDWRRHISTAPRRRVGVRYQRLRLRNVDVWISLFWRQLCAYYENRATSMP